MLERNQQSRGNRCASRALCQPYGYEQDASRIDLGTSGRAAIVDDLGQLKAEGSARLESAAMRDPVEWWRAVQAAIVQALTHVSAGDICSVAVSATSGTVLAVDGVIARPVRFSCIPIPALMLEFCGIFGSMLELDGRVLARAGWARWRLAVWVPRALPIKQTGSISIFAEGGVETAVPLSKRL